MASTLQYCLSNKDLWDSLTDVNLRSAFYDVEGFKRGRSSLHEYETAEVGDVQGKSLLHLQCHFGMDTMSWARLGARVTGVDFSKRAVAAAQALSSELDIPARFIEADIYDLPSQLDEKFDVVFTSYGVLLWLPDIVRWAEVVSRFMKPGGTFFIIDAHPILWTLDDRFTSGLVVKRSYFPEGAPYAFPARRRAYSDPSAIIASPQYYWLHSLSSIISALLTQGLHLDYVREHPYLAWQALPVMVQDESGMWTLPPAYPSFPLGFSVRALLPSGTQVT